MDQENNYGTVLPPYWTEVWIIAGGPSARNFDMSRLDGQTILVVNDACFLPTPAVTAFFSLDKDWIRGHRDFLMTYNVEKYLALPLETWPDCAGIPGATYLEWAYEYGLSDNPRYINTGGNSGFGAINLAYLKHAHKIHLIGYDMDPSEHEKYLAWIPVFRTMRMQLNRRAIEVVNHNPNSFIDAFHKEVLWPR
jgi:hypothetical protein